MGYYEKNDDSYLVFSNFGVDLNLENEPYIIIWLIQKLWEKWREMTDSKIVKNDYKWHMGNIQIKYKIISIVQYKIVEDLAFFVKPQKIITNQYQSLTL